MSEAPLAAPAGPGGAAGAAAALIVRPYESADAAAIAAIHQQPQALRNTLAMPFRAPESIAAWHAPLERGTAGGFALCAVAGGEVVGHLALFVQPAPRAHAAGFGIAVHDAHAGRGIGARLMREMLAAADGALGLRRIELTVFDDNQRAIALYARFGFVVEARQRAFAVRDGELADALSMARVSGAPPLAPASR
ncbi:GNAT family N-acetyltransferase [Burkholderia glumae]|uniref:GNAT family N-acetyltransferase n=1 Tax=Burkholderia glumae TaxID=337 RepID=A0ABY5B756_BURGL|nr:GNAT family N-acetyltransferase [Burkholderia glumae]KHJ61531.1 acetyltransferase [Burkholderia glumae]MCM2484255.1 GNAT family N-acetyltransferase [Burkholderia glumae]MCM2509946.1 GNAT family N-acetyltransferase [Burkholderia glumae]MCM2539708.1 GNAT family N-acetyltransferase [Burkholderia glumae]MCM2551329.1 GNAT family N-acetyltransferase [Burkholderia glumae]